MTDLKFKVAPLILKPTLLISIVKGIRALTIDKDNAPKVHAPLSLSLSLSSWSKLAMWVCSFDVMSSK